MTGQEARDSRAEDSEEVKGLTVRLRLEKEENRNKKVLREMERDKEQV